MPNSLHVQSLVLILSVNVYWREKHNVQDFFLPSHHLCCERNLLVSWNNLYIWKSIVDFWTSPQLHTTMLYKYLFMTCVDLIKMTQKLCCIQVSIGT